MTLLSIGMELATKVIASLPGGSPPHPDHPRSASGAPAGPLRRQMKHLNEQHPELRGSMSQFLRSGG
eukprot:6721052-Alexandrium_andersonii.AAC.1